MDRMNTSENNAYVVGPVLDFYLKILEYAANPIIVALGIVGNILSFCVMVYKRNRSSPPSIYMAGLAVSDFFGILTVGGVIL